MDRVYLPRLTPHEVQWLFNRRGYIHLVDAPVYGSRGRRLTGWYALRELSIEIGRNADTAVSVSVSPFDPPGYDWRPYLEAQRTRERATRSAGTPVAQSRST